MGPRCTGIREALEQINAVEHAHGRRLLSVLVECGADRQQAAGFAPMALRPRRLTELGDERAFADAEPTVVIEYWITRRELAGCASSPAE